MLIITNKKYELKAPINLNAILDNYKLNAPKLITIFNKYIQSSNKKRAAQ